MASIITPCNVAPVQISVTNSTAASAVTLSYISQQWITAPAITLDEHLPPNTATKIVVRVKAGNVGSDFVSFRKKQSL